MITQNYDKKLWMTIDECLKVSGYHNSYFRMKVLKLGKIEAKKEFIPGTQIPRVLVNRKSFEQYMIDHPRGERTNLTEEMKEVLSKAGYNI